MMSYKGYMFLALCIIASIGCASAIPYQAGNFDPVRSDHDYWVCYDYAIDSARNNQEYGIVTVSTNPNFIGVSHMLNYQIVNDTISFYDPFWSDLTSNEFVYTVDISDRRMDNQYFYPAYYKFWSEDEAPLRNYRRLKDNSAVWLNV